MSDLISRKAAIDAIRKDMYADKDYMSAMICEGIEDVLNGLPSAQPEIIRCKDCKHYKTDHPRANGYHCCYRMHNIFPMKPDDFCSHTERREDGTP